MQHLDSPVEIEGIEFSNPLLNGAYINSKTLEDMEMLAESAAGGLVAGSISIEPRGANPGPGYWLHKERFFSLNSYGMPNGGFPYFRTNLPKIVETAHAAGKPLVANLIGFGIDEWPELVSFAEDSGVDVAELNFGCPNVWEENHQERIVSYHASLVRAVLERVVAKPRSIKVAAKISPLPPDILQEVAGVITESGVVQIVTATNSYPNAAVTYGARGNQWPDNTLAGMAGRALKPISLGVVQQLHQLLPEHIHIIGCGGIASANDAQDYLDAGAKAVQIATALKEEGPSIFEKIIYQSKP